MISPPSKVTRAGQDFSYALWTPGTVVQLCRVPWQSDYGDVVYFRSNKQLREFLAKDAHTITLEKMTYCRVGEPIIIPTPFNVANQYNYVRVFNPAQPVEGDNPVDYYYFIEGVEHLSPGATQLYLQLDVWQTFSRRMRISSCYVAQGHYGIYLDNTRDRWSGSRYADVDEGHDIGGELGVAYQKQFKIRDDGAVSNTSMVMFSNTALLEDPGGNADPRLEPANGTTIHFHEARNTGSFRSSCDVALFPDSNSYSSLQHYYLRKRPWVAQGIFALYLTPGIRGNNRPAIWNFTAQGACTPTSAIYDVEMTLSDDIQYSVASCYPLEWQQYKKLFSYPYSVIELTTHTGNPIILKPQLIHTKELKVRADICIMLPQPNVCVYPLGYNRKPYGTSFHVGPENLAGDSVDMMTGYFNLPQMPLVHDSYGLYMASNRNSIAYQHKVADWSHTKALASNKAAYDMQTQNMNSMAAATGINNQVASMQNSVANKVVSDRAWLTGANQLAGGIAGAVGGGAVGAIGALGGAAMGIASTAASASIDIAQNNANLAISRHSNSAHLQNSLGTAKYNRDTNKQLADFAAHGDYQMAIAGINAKIQDADLVPPTVTGQVGGDIATISREGGFGLWLKIKVPNSGKASRIVWQWARYGYMINEFISDFRYLNLMRKVTYWRLMDVKFSRADMPEQYRRTLKGVFERGVSVWRNVDDMLHFNANDNLLLSENELEAANG